MARIILILMLAGAVTLVAVLAMAALGGAADRLAGRAPRDGAEDGSPARTALRGAAWGLLWLLMAGLAAGLVGTS